MTTQISALNQETDAGEVLILRNKAQEVNGILGRRQAETGAEINSIEVTSSFVNAERQQIDAKLAEDRHRRMKAVEKVK